MTTPSRMTCKETFCSLDDYVDRALEGDEVTRVEGHLVQCVACAAKYRFEASFVRELREKIARIEAPAELMERISRALRSEDG